MRRWGFMALVLACGASVWAEGDEAKHGRVGSFFAEKADFSGLLELEWGLGLEDGSSQKFEVQILPELNLSLSDNVDLTVIGRFRADALDELEPGSPGQPEIGGPARRLLIGEHAELELRELYFDTTAGGTYLRIGKQQIVWGTADGLKVLDVINPQDFREFILDDFDDSRIPLWTFNAEIPIKGTTLQLIWIPDQTYHKLPEVGAAYEITAVVPAPPPGIRVRIREPQRPSRVVSDSDVGARLSLFAKGWDLSFSYFYHYDDIPVFYRRIIVTPLGPEVIVEPEYERTHLVGATFSNAFGDLTLRGEVGFSFRKFFSTASLFDVDGVVESDEFAFVLGLDWFGVSDTFISFQFFQSILTTHPHGLLRDRVETNLSFLIQRDFLNDTVKAEAIWVHNVNDGDGFIRPKVTYEFRDNMKFWAGVDFFYGTGRGLFGEFDANDRIIMGIEWGF